MEVPSSDTEVTESIKLFVGLLAFVGVVTGSFLSYFLSRRAAKKEAKTEHRPKLYLKIVEYVVGGRASFDPSKSQDLMNELLLFGKHKMITRFIAVIDESTTDEQHRKDVYELIKIMRLRLKVDSDSFWGSKVLFWKKLPQKQSAAIHLALEWLNKNSTKP